MSDKLDRILAEISAGELIDKITILEIKKAKISEKEKLVEVNKVYCIPNAVISNKTPKETHTSTVSHS